MRKHKDIWPQLLEWCIKQDEKVQYLGRQSDARQFRIQEDGFWRFYCPNIERVTMTWADMINRNTNTMRTSRTPVEFLQTASPSQILEYWIKHGECLARTLQSSRSTYTSVVLRDLLDYCDLFEGLDVLAFPGSTENAWKNANWEESETVGLIRIRIWVNDFHQLLIDPIGFEIFVRSLEPTLHAKEFVKRVEDLKTRVSNTEELTVEAKNINDEFIKLLDLPSNIKFQLGTLFASQSHVSANCFDSVLLALDVDKRYARLWMQMQTLKSVIDKDIFWIEAESIWNMMLLMEESIEIFGSSIMSELRQKLDSMKELSFDCFQKAQEILFDLMRDTSFERFCQSDYLHQIFLKAKPGSKNTNAMSLRRPKV